MLPTPVDVFAGFGPSKYLRRTSPGQIELSTDFPEVRSQLRTDCPAVPGVYGMIDCVGRLVYVGMSRNLRKRTVTYFQAEHSSHGSENHRKEARVASRAQRLVWEPTGHELLAALREHELIRRFMPEMNIRGRRRRRLVYVFLSVEDAPRFQVGSQLPKSCRHHWGPVPRSSQLLRAVEALNRYFRLPDCKPEIRMRFADQTNLFDLDLYPRCLRGEMNRCLAPCAAAITCNEYVAQLNRARAFLNGRDNAPLAEIDEALRQAVSERRFEQAAHFRDLRTDLVDLREQLLPRSDLLPASFVYNIQRRNRLCWLVVHEATVMKVAPGPRDPQIAARWLARLENWRETVMPLIDERDGSELQILASWFRRHPLELERVMDFDSAHKACRQWPRG